MGIVIWVQPANLAQGFFGRPLGILLDQAHEQFFYDFGLNGGVFVGQKINSQN